MDFVHRLKLWDYKFITIRKLDFASPPLFYLKTEAEYSFRKVADFIILWFIQWTESKRTVLNITTPRHLKPLNFGH